MSVLFLAFSSREASFECTYLSYQDSAGMGFAGAFCPILDFVSGSELRDSADDILESRKERQGSLDTANHAEFGIFPVSLTFF